MIYSRIGNAKLNGLAPFAYRHTVLERIDELLPSNLDAAFYGSE